jgi:RHS repeat-associated protein
MNNFAKDVVPVSPNAAALGKYTDIPIELSTGVPNINVPIYTIQEGPLSVPISLSYHASGVKVNEVASWVGLGWSLNAGGIITRTILSTPDDALYSGMFSNRRITPSVNSRFSTDNIEYYGSALMGQSVDSEPDIFSFNFGGYSGKFLFDAEGTCHLIPKQDIKILLNNKFTSVPSNFDDLNDDLSFTIITPDGNKYAFGTGSYKRFENGSAGGNPVYFKESFYLDKVESADGKFWVNFEYGQKESFTLRTNANEQKVLTYPFEETGPYVADIVSNNPEHPNSTRYIARMGQKIDNYHTLIEKFTGDPLITKITTSSGSLVVKFIHSTSNRLDLEYITSPLPSQYGRSLYQIEVYSGNTTKSFTHKYQLNHSYFSVGTKAYQKRLKLNSIDVLSDNSPTPVSTYKFAYENGADGTMDLPNRLSKAIDHWGYYNGATQNDNNALNIPTTAINNIEYGSSDRSSNETYMKIGTLTKVEYPTGGYTQFQYEANRAKLPEKEIFIYAEVDCNAPKVQKYFFMEINNLNNLNITLKLNRDIVNCAGQTNVSATVKVYHPIYGLIYQLPATLAAGSDEVTINKNSTVDANDLLSLSNIDQNKIVVEVVGGRATVTLWKSLLTASETIVGGLRIKTVAFGKSANDANPTIRNYSYTESTTNLATSGVLLSGIPVYGFRFKKMLDLTSYPLVGVYAIVHNTSITPLSDFEGYHIRYKRVVVSETGKGMSEYLYDVEASPNDKSFPTLATQYRKNNGKLKKQTQYSATNGIVGESTYMPTDESRESLIRGNFVRMIAYSTHTLSSNFPVFPNEDTHYGSGTQSFGVMYQYYRIKTSVYRLKEQIDIKDGITTSTKFDYYVNNLPRPLYPISIRMTNSDGLETETINKYVHEFEGGELVDGEELLPGQTQGVMIDKNIIGTPIQTIKKVNGKVVEGSRIKFTLFKTSTGNLFTASDGNAYLNASVYANKLYAYKPLSTTFDNNWLLEGTFPKYDNITGKPKEFIPKGWWITQTFDWYRNGMIKEKNVGGLKWKYEIYDNSNQLKSITDENGFKTAFDYDGLMRLKETKTFFADGSPRATMLNTYNYRPAIVPTADANKQEFNNYVKSKTTFEGITDPLITTQIMDGLGRPFEVIKEKYTPKVEPHLTEAWQQKTYMTYDIFGRPDKSYQPFESSTIDVETPPSGTDYTYPKYEDSPLSRPLREYAEDGKYVRMEYGSNTSAEVRFFSVSATNAVSAAGYYAADLLYKTTMTNENGTTVPNGNVNKTDVFRDKLGRTILTRKYLDNTEAGKADTYNVYDDFDNLIMVIPPGAIDASNNILMDLVFTYKYNNKNLMSEKKVPGAEKQVFYYDNRDLLTLTQDGNTRAANPDKYLATGYDELSRQVRTGYIETATPVSDLANWVFNWTQDLIYSSFLPNTNLPNGANIKPIGNLTGNDRTVMYRGVAYNAKREQEWGCPEYLRYHNCEDWVFNSDGSLKISNKYNNGPVPVGSTNIYQVFYGQKYEYDHARRNTSVQQQLWGPTNTGVNFFAPWTELAGTSYNYKDQVIEKNIGKRMDIWGAKPLQSIDYQYNKRGWLTAINQTKMSFCAINLASTNCVRLPVDCATTAWNISSGDFNVDLFGEKISYDAPIPGETLPTRTPQYNGNISQNVWEVAGREAQAYTYSYDALDRLTSAYYNDVNEKNLSDPCSSDNKYEETVAYDLRGNIKTLFRRGLTNKSISASGAVIGTYGIIDDLEYAYTDLTNRNRLANVVDKADPLKGFKYKSTATGYTYDANGNLKSDPHKGILNITYNFLNLPEIIQFDNNNRIEFVYDATGMKLRKSIYKAGVLAQVRDYMDGFEYVDQKIDRIVHAEGYLTTRPKTTADNNDFVGFDGSVWQYNYTLRDHLGNTRVTFADVNNDRQIVPNTNEVNQINHYYSFGMNIDGNWNGASPNVKNKYQYNDKELQSEFGLDWNDYGFRMYDAAIGRFSTIDPLGEIYDYQTPYAYADNNPVNLIDYMGLGASGTEPVKTPDGIMLPEVTVTATRLPTKATGGLSLFGIQMPSLPSFSDIIPIPSPTSLEAARNAVESNMNPFVERNEPENDDEAIGQRAGDMLSVLIGMAEAVEGTVFAAGGGAITITTGGLTSPISVPVALAGATAAAHGVFTLGNGWNNTMNPTTVRAKGNSGKKAADSSKSEQHGDNGRALENLEKNLKPLREKLENATGTAAQKIRQKIQNITRDAQNKNKGTNDGNNGRRK